MSLIKRIKGLFGIRVEIMLSIITSIILISQLFVLNRQLIIQSKAMKADNLIKLNQQIYPCIKMKEIMEAVYIGEPILIKDKGIFTEAELDNFLGYFEMLGIMETRGYLDAGLIYDMFGADIDIIARNSRIQQYLEDEQSKGYSWPFLRIIINKIKAMDN